MISRSAPPMSNSIYNRRTLNIFNSNERMKIQFCWVLFCNFILTISRLWSPVMFYKCGRIKPQNLRTCLDLLILIWFSTCCPISSISLPMMFHHFLAETSPHFTFFICQLRWAQSSHLRVLQWENWLIDLMVTRSGQDNGLESANC